MQLLGKCPDHAGTWTRRWALAGALTTELHGEVAAMNRENFIVRMQLEAVERFQHRESWERAHPFRCRHTAE